MNKLTKAQEKRFDEKVSHLISDTPIGVIDDGDEEITITKRTPRTEIKQHLADELSRQRKYFRKLKEFIRFWKHNDELWDINGIKADIDNYIEDEIDKELSRQKKEIIEELEKMKVPESYEKIMKVRYGWASDLEFDDARIGYNKALDQAIRVVKEI